MSDSKILDNHKRGRVGDFLVTHVSPKSKLSFVSAYFTIYAFDKMKEQLSEIESIDFLYGEPTFIKHIDPAKNHSKAFKIEDDNLIIPPDKRLTQKRIAKECAEWISQKANIRSMVKPNFLHGKAYLIQNPNQKDKALIGSSNFTVSGLGMGGSPNIELNTEIDSDRDREELWKWFYEIWDDNKGLVEDVKQEVLKYLGQLYSDHTPEFIYYKTLFHLFERFLNEQAAGGLLNEKTGFYQSQVWNLLYAFQKDAVVGAINKILRHNGCIIADSVGLGKTFEAIGVIKYFQLLNYKVLVLCPKKLADNWTMYQAQNNSELNPLLEDRLSYTVLSHTDLSRDKGKSIGGMDLETINWGNYDLIVIDESHNFRNNTKGKKDAMGKERPSRYERLMNEIINSGIQTKVLLLSATPVNNNLRDLRNQIHIITGQNDAALLEKTQIGNIGQLLAQSQKIFTAWSSSKNANRTVKNLMERLDSAFFKLLDELTIARSRKHINTYYKSEMQRIGAFPTRKPVMSVYPDIDIQQEFPTYNQLNKAISNYKLAIFHPSEYVSKQYSHIYDDKFEGDVMAFKQADRERHLIGMMKVNFLKRLESSIFAFEITLDRTINKIENLITKIHDYQNFVEKTATTIEAEIPEDEDDDDMTEIQEAWAVGKKIKFELKHIDLDKWLADLDADKKELVKIQENARMVNSERDAKLKALKALILAKIRKPLNANNNKAIVFTAFADTAYYLYDNLKDWAKNELGLHIAVVAGGSRENLTTFKPKGFHFQTQFQQILTNFSPVAKKRDKMKAMPQTGEIDILIATDCISEGQNLQDCDFLVNYDIHWNPVRIIQRFGRIDRLGSKNKAIQLVNFWPTKDLDAYINLKERVEARMALVDITATNEDNILNPEELEDLVQSDLKFRDKQLKRLQEEVLDLEEMNESVSLGEFTLDDFRMDLVRYLEKNKDKLAAAPLGLYAVVPALNGDYTEMGKYDKTAIEAAAFQIIQPGVIFCLKHQQTPENEKNKHQEVNPLYPYFMVYLYDNGELKYNYTHPKQILEIYRILCQDKATPYDLLCDLFNAQTQEGCDMKRYEKQIKEAAHRIKATFDKRTVQKLQSSRGATLFKQDDHITKLADFELITWLVVC